MQLARALTDADAKRVQDNATRSQLPLAPARPFNAPTSAMSWHCGNDGYAELNQAAGEASASRDAGWPP